jgi:hypothetical protein
VSDDDLAAWICAHLPALRESARRFRWENKLAAALADISAGKDAELALRRRGLPVDALREEVTPRGDPVALDAFRLDRVPATGDYGCPGSWPCGRREGRDSAGHEPRCNLHDRLMTYTVRPAG